MVFSDEDDHSSVAVSDVLGELEDQRDGASVKVHAVVGDPPAGCVSALAAADVGTRYLEAQAITEGRLHAFTGPVNKQDGSPWLKAGETADDGTLLGMNFYVEGIEGSLP